MSYCRWSTNDFQCDVYVYEDVAGGWTTHVACNRVLYNEPLPDPVPFDKESIDAFIERHNKVMEMVNNAERVPIGGPSDGQSFNDATPGKCADWLEVLRSEGYIVPQFAIDTLKEEEAECEHDWQPAALGPSSEIHECSKCGVTERRDRPL